MVDRWLIRDSVSDFLHHGDSNSKAKREVDGWMYCITGGQFLFFLARLFEAKLRNGWGQQLFAFNHLECSTTWMISAPLFLDQWIPMEYLCLATNLKPKLVRCQALCLFLG